jgi:hypothetical protein
MMARTQVTLDLETQRRARKRAAELGISFAHYIRRLVARDLATPPLQTDASIVFDLGLSTRADIRRKKDAMIGEAVVAGRGHHK